MIVSLQGGVRAFLAGFLMAAPLGPVAFMVFRQVLKNQLHLALFAGAGAALADALLGFFALLGMRWSDMFLESYQKEFRIGGGIFLMILGILLLKRPPHPTTKTSPDRPLWIFLINFLITLCNPLALTAFIAIFSILKLKTSCSDLLSTSLLALCVFFGATLWWAGLSFLSYWGRQHFGISDVVRINRCISLILIFLGFYAFMTSGLFSVLLPQE